MTESVTFVAAQMPHLRRFARILTGAQVLGDAYALAALEAALDGPAFASETDARIWLYRAMMAIWMPIAGRESRADAASESPGSAGDLNVMAVPPLPRAAFLLQSMEEFDFDQVAVIMHRSISGLERLIDEASEALAAQINREPLIASDARPIPIYQRKAMPFTYCPRIGQPRFFDEYVESSPIVGLPV